MNRQILTIALLALVTAGTASAQRTLTDPGLRPTGSFPAVNDHGALGSLTFYPDRASFRAVHPGLAMEDFTGTLVASGEADHCPAPLDATTADECFPAGGVIPGFAFQVVRDGGWDADYAIVNNIFRLNCVGIGPNFFVNETNWGFKPAVAAVAMDIYTPLDRDETFIIEVFGPSGSLGAVAFGTQGISAAFFGVDTVDPDGITRIEVRETLEDRGEVFCDLEFGNATVPVELQSVEIE